MTCSTRAGIVDPWTEVLALCTALSNAKVSTFSQTSSPFIDAKHAVAREALPILLKVETERPTDERLLDSPLCQKRGLRTRMGCWFRERFLSGDKNSQATPPPELTEKDLFTYRNLYLSIETLALRVRNYLIETENFLNVFVVTKIAYEDPSNKEVQDFEYGVELDKSATHVKQLHQLGLGVQKCGDTVHRLARDQKLTFAEDRWILTHPEMAMVTTAKKIKNLNSQIRELLSYALELRECPLSYEPLSINNWVILDCCGRISAKSNLIQWLQTSTFKDCPWCRDTSNIQAQLL